MDWLFVLGVLSFVVVILFTIAIHEAGHMVAAKALKLDVPEYSIGFGKKLFTRKGKKTEYNLRAIPLGGFVLIKDESYPEGSYERDSLSRVSPWKRQIVFFAGPLVNIVFGAALIVGLLLATPYASPSNQVALVHDCSSIAGCTGEEIGLQVGDFIIEIDGVKVDSYVSLGVAKDKKSHIETMTVLREGKEIVIEDFDLHYNADVDAYFLGIQASSETYRSIADAWTFVTFSVEQNFRAILGLPEKLPAIVSNVFTGEKEEGDPASVVAAGKSYGDMAASQEITLDDKVFTFIYWSAVFNIGIGFINLIPLLPLDGGRMMIALSDSFRLAKARLTKKDYAPLGQKAFTALSVASALVVFSVFILIIASDVSAIAAGNI